MHLEPRKVDVLKRWIVKNIEARSDADSDVLADYVVALVTSDVGPLPSSKAHYVENLKDFLAANTQPFVDDLFAALYLNSFDPSYPQSRPKPPSYQPRPPKDSRKRSYHNRDGNANASSQERSSYDGERPTKHTRRSVRNFNGHIEAGRAQASVHQVGGSQQVSLPSWPPTLSGMPPKDATDVMSAFLAMQQAMTEMLNGASPPSANTGFPYNPHRCTDYDTKGYCAAGSSCPYEHGDDPYVIPSSYDPTYASWLDLTPNHVAHIENVSGTPGRGGSHGRGQKRGDRTFRGGGKRASFSQNGPNRDPSATAVVVEQIPKDRCDEASVRAFFQDFGTIDKITIHPERSLAIVKFKSNKSARAAYESPKVIFDNRFVKVYWHKPDSNPHYSTIKHELPDAGVNGESFVWEDSSDDDLEDFVKRQEEAQRKYEDTHQRLEEIRKQWRDIDSRLKEIEVERKSVAESIREKTGQPFLPLLEASGNEIRHETEQTRALKEQLAKLEAEAKSLGIDPEAASTYGYHSPRNHRGRRGYRGGGRGTFGSYRAHNGPSVMRLDNRTKTIGITFLDGDFGSRGEALRQFLLLNSLDPVSMEQHPERKDTVFLTFNHRYEGEILVDRVTQFGIEHIGPVELAWFKADDAATNGVNGLNGDGQDHEADNGDLQVSANVIDAHASDDPEDEDLDRIS